MPKIDPPNGYKTWLDVAQEYVDDRAISLAMMFDGVDVQRDQICNAIAEELSELREKAAEKAAEREAIQALNKPCHCDKCRGFTEDVG